MGTLLRSIRFIYFSYYIFCTDTCLIMLCVLSLVYPGGILGLEDGGIYYTIRHKSRILKVFQENEGFHQPDGEIL